LASGDSFSGALTRAAGEGFGTYAIGQGTLAVSNSSNYTLNFIGASLTINKKIINVTAAAKSKTYGDTDPALTYTADALIGGDSFTGAISRAAGESFGTYVITQGTLALSSNYTLNYTGANLSIGKRTIDIYSGSRDVQYGDPDGTIGYSYSGTPVAGDVFSGALGREPGTALGTYATTIGTFQISNGGNYDLIFHSAPFNIIQREITVSGGSTYKIYGDADPAINYSIYSGTLLGGTQITGALVRDAGETAGPYNVGQGTLAINDANYKLIYQGGYFEIDRAPLTFTIDNKTKVATKPNPALTYSVSGYKNGDTEATAFTAPINLTTDATLTSAAGNYNIYPIGGVTATNYNISQVGGTLTVTPASTVNTLASATVNGGGFDSGAFDPTTDFYSVSIPNGSTSATLIVTVTDPLSSISIGYDPATAVPVASGAPYTITFSNNNTQQVPVNVTAEDGSIKSYYFNINPIPSDSKLSNLGSSVGIIAPSFNPLVTAYTLNVSAETESVIITPTTHDPAAKARVNGGAGGGGEGGAVYGAKNVLLYEGTNNISINVKSADNTGNTFYTLTINRPITLAGLALSAGTLSPAFDPTVTTYTAKVPESVPSVTITPSARQDFYQLLVNGEYVSNNTASAPITIADGPANVITTKITAGDGVSSKTYTINAVHASSNADLAGISVSEGTLDPVFESATGTYNVYLPNSVSAISFTPTLANANATMKVNAADATSGAAINISNLSVGLHNYYIVVTAEDGVVTKTYTLSITRALSSEPGLANLTLSQGTLSPAFNPTADPNYSVTLPAGVESVDITPVLIDTTASLQARLNGHNLPIPNQHLITVPVNALYNTLIITSTAQDGTTIAIYTITLERPTSTDATLSGLTTSIGTFTSPFNSAAIAYDLIVPDETININLTPVATSGFASIKVNGVPMAKGFSSQSLPVSAPVNIYPIEVTAESGATNTIMVRVLRETAINPNLASLTSSVGTLSPAFGADVLNYAMEVAVNVSSITFTPTSVDPSAAITVNGTTVASGAASAPITLYGGENTVNVTVAPSAGGIAKSYTVVVTRKASNNVTLTALSTDPDYKISTITGPADFNRSITVPFTVTSLRFLAVTKSPAATMTINGAPHTSGTLSAPIALTSTTQQVNIVVSAQDGLTVGTYAITVIRKASDNAILASISTTPTERITTVAGPADYNRAILVPTNVTSLSFTAVTQHAGATMTINGAPLASGATSVPIALGLTTPVNIVVTAEDGTTVKTYAITVTRKASDNAVLASITTNPDKSLVPVSGPADFNRVISVPSSLSSITFTATPQDANASIKIDGVTLPVGVSSAPVALTGSATVVNIAVTAEDSIATKTYQITINKILSANAVLASITTNPDRSITPLPTGPADYNRSISVPTSLSSITFAAIPQDAGATIQVNGVTVAAGAESAPVLLTSMATVVDILVTAEDGVTTKSYQLTVNKVPATNAVLSKIVTNPTAKLTTTTGPANYNRAVTVPVGTSSITVACTTQHPGATVKINGATVASTAYSSPITLTGEATVINILVTAEDGITTKTYQLTVNRPAPLIIAAAPVSKQTDVGVIQRTDASLKASPEDFIVKQAVSPNGDGVNDRLTIDGIDLFPNNTVRIMNRNGDVIYEAKGYDNMGQSFDGRSSRGTLQQPGTYFYSVEYKKGSETKRKTGYIVIKY
jgi:gliding motility-associated-like protein